MHNATRCRLMIWGQMFNVFPDDKASYVLVAMFSILNVFIVLANIAAISTFAYARCAAHWKHHDWVKVENSITNILMSSLVISDAVFGITGVPLIVIELNHNGSWTLGPAWCFVKVLAHYLWGPLVMFHVVCMAVDRFLAVCKPLVYRRLSYKVGYGLVGLCWTLSLLVVLTPMAAKWLDFAEDVQPCSGFSSVCDFRRSRVFVILNYVFIGFLPITSILLLYFCIVRCIVRSSNRIADSNHNLARQQRLDGQKFKKSSDYEKTAKIEDGDLNVYSAKSLGKYFRDQLFYDANSTISIIDTQVNNFAIGENTLKTGLDTSLQVSGDKTFLEYSVKSKLEAPTNHESQHPILDTLTKRLEKPLSQDTPSGLQDANFVIASAALEETAKKFRFSTIRGATFKSKPRDGNPITREHRKLRAVRTIGLVVLCFSISWLPAFISVPIFTINKTTMPSWLILFITFCNYSNAALDPVLFCCNRDVRHIMKIMMVKVLGSFRKK